MDCQIPSDPQKQGKVFQYIRLKFETKNELKKMCLYSK